MPGWGFETWWMMGLGVLVMLLFWGGLIALVFFAIQAIVRSGQTRDDRRTSVTGGETPLDILKGRYARGEITREEYLEMRRDLES